MKKMSVCIPLFCKLIASVTLLFVSLYFSATIKAQSEKQDSAFKKWEVSFDLKPLFRSDQPYNVFIARNLTERKAIRVGLSVVDWGKTKDTVIYSQMTLDSNNRNSIGFGQFKVGDKTKFNFAFSIGYRYEFSKGKICLYSSTDIKYKKKYQNSVYPVSTSSLGDVSQPAIDTLTFQGYNSLSDLISETQSLFLIQSLGIRYYVNKSFSFSIESSLLFGYTKFKYAETHLAALIYPYSTGRFDTTTANVENSQEYSFQFQPILGLYLNYHF